MSRRALLPLLFAALLLPGCFGGKAPVTTVWSLPAPERGGPASNAKGPALGVKRFKSSAELRTTKLTYREAGGRQIKHYSYHEWADYPDRIVEERMHSLLISTGAFRSVTEAPPSTDLDAVLSARLLEFDEWDAPGEVRVSVSLRWELKSADGELTLDQDVTTARLDAGVTPKGEPTSEDMARIVEAYEAATSQVLGEIGDRVVAALSQD